MSIDPHSIIGKRVPAADGGDYGDLIVGFDPVADDFLVIPIVWSTGEVSRLSTVVDGHMRLDRFKASYRYQLDKAI